jgi:hypothetical protein
MNFDLKTAIGSIAPTLATMLGGPLAGTAVGALCGALGLSPGSSADDVTKVVQAGMTPDAIAAVRAADQKHEETMRQQGIDLVKMNTDFATAQMTVDASDRDSARKREMSVGGWTTPVLAWVVVGASLALGGAVIAGYVTSDPKQAVLVGTVIGSVMSEAKQVLAYYFGSSASSARKDATLADIAKS